MAEARSRNGWTQKQVGDWAGLDASRIAQYEAGQNCTALTLAKIAGALRVSSDWLLQLEA